MQKNIQFPADSGRPDLAGRVSPWGESAASILAAPARWKFVSPFMPCQGSSAPGTRVFRQWMAKHRHTHPFYEVMLPLRGAAWYGVGGAVFYCRPGTMLIIAPNQPHASRYRLEDAVEHAWISFITPAQAFLQYVSVSNGKVRRIHGERSLINVAGLSRLLQSLQRLAEGQGPLKNLRINLLLTAFSAELIHLLIDTGSRPPEVIDREALMREKIGMICGHVRAIGGKTNLAELALLTGYTPGHFARLFKRLAGQTVHQYIDACRLERAKALLAARVPMKAMAIELGFADKTTLSRWLGKFRHAM